MPHRLAGVVAKGVQEVGCKVQAKIREGSYILGLWALNRQKRR